MKKSVLLAAAAAILASATANAATVVTNGSVVTGATGVVVNGTTYDVTFNNLCSQAYGSCSASGTFAFTDNASATAAAQALHDQVFTAGVSTQALGCDAAYAANCYSLVGYLDSGAIAAKLLLNSDAAGAVYDFPLSDTDYANGSYVAFTNATPSVPEPATWGMLMLGFGGLGYAMRRRPKVATRIRFA